MDGTSIRCTGSVGFGPVPQRPRVVQGGTKISGRISEIAPFSRQILYVHGRDAADGGRIENAIGLGWPYTNLVVALQCGFLNAETG